MLRSIRRPLLAVTAAAVLATAGCDSGDAPTGPTDPPPPAPTVTETFSGNLTVNGAQTFTFTSNVGNVTATLSAIGPDETTIVGLSLGTWNGIICQEILANDKAQRLTVVTGRVNAGVNLCARVRDVGNLTSTATFEITVVHP